MGSKSTNRLYSDMISYKVDKKDTKDRYEVCERCGKEFTYKLKDVKDRTIKCPNCGHDIVFFSFI